MTGQGRGGGDPVVDLEVVEGLDLEQLVVEACEAPFAAAMAADHAPAMQAMMAMRANAAAKPVKVKMMVSHGGYCKKQGFRDP